MYMYIYVYYNIEMLTYFNLSCVFGIVFYSLLLYVSLV